MAPKRPTPIEDPPSASSSEEEEDSEEEVQPQQQSHSDLATVKKPRSKPTTPVKPSAKRPVEDSGADAKDSKRAKSKASVEVEGDGSKPPGNDSKKAFERIFQPADEVSLLSGMLDYSAKNGADPVTDIDGFYLYIKKSVHVDFNKTQLLNKIKRLKKKYKNNAKRKGKNGAERTFSKAVEQESYFLSKNIWGDEGVNVEGGVKVVDHAKSNGKAKKTSQVTQAEEDELLASIPAPKVKKLEKRDAMKLNSGPSNSIFINKSLVSSGLDDNFLKQGMGLIDGAKKSELEEKWRKLQIDEIELFLRRIVLVREQTKLVVDAYKK